MSSELNDKHRGMARSVLVFCAIGIAAALVLAGVDALTRERIEHAREQRAAHTLEQLLPPGATDNDLVRDRVSVRIPGLPSPVTVYRGRYGDEPVALLVDVVTPEGYGGEIRLLVAVTPAGELFGVRVLEHRETPGLGDRVEAARSDWIHQFSGRGPANPAPEAWAPDRRGGAFDTLTNATITSSAVIHAVRRVVEFTAAEAAMLFTMEAATG